MTNLYTLHDTIIMTDCNGHKTTWTNIGGGGHDLAEDSARQANLGGHMHRPSINRGHYGCPMLMMNGCSSYDSNPTIIKRHHSPVNKLQCLFPCTDVPDKNATVSSNTDKLRTTDHGKPDHARLHEYVIAQLQASVTW